MKVTSILLFLALLAVAGARLGNEEDDDGMQRNLVNEKDKIKDDKTKEKNPTPPFATGIAPLGPDGSLIDGYKGPTFHLPDLPDQIDSNNRKWLIGLKPGKKNKVKSKIKKEKIKKEFNLIDVLAVETSVEEAEELANDSDIEYVEADTKVSMVATYEGGWVMGVSPDGEWEAYGIRQTQGNAALTDHTEPGYCNDPDTFKLAIVDSGFRADHPDSPCVPDAINGGYINCMGAEFGVTDPWDAPVYAFHGTHVGGIADAIGGNAQGVVSMNPEGKGICYLFPRVFNEGGAGANWSAIFAAVEWAVANGAKVINMSLSGSYAPYSGQAIFNAIAAQGTLSVAAAGNSGTWQYEYPSSYDNVISVAAVDANNGWASFSTYNWAVDVCAPGLSVWGMTTAPYADATYGPYMYASGTSMAAPHVTGAIAKAWSRCPACSASTVESCLEDSAKLESFMTPYLYAFGKGVVKAEDMYDCLNGICGCDM